MRQTSFRLTLAVAIGLLVAATVWPNPKTLPEFVQDLVSPTPETQVTAAKQILNNPGEVPVIALERATLIAGQQVLLDTKQPLITILQNTSHRGTTRAIAADSLGLMARANPDSPENIEIYTILILASYDNSWDVRLGACRALGNTGNINAAFRLTEMFYGDADPRVQLIAGKAYLQLTGNYTESSSPTAPTPDSIYQRIMEYVNIHIRIVR